MELKIYKCGIRRVLVEYFTDIEEIPYHRYFLALKLAGFSGQVGDNVDGIISDANHAMILFENNPVKAKQFIQNIKNRMNFVESGFHLSLASAFPFIYSINGKVLKTELSVDDCIVYARKYKNYLPMIVAKKKTKFWHKLKQNFLQGSLKKQKQLK